MNNQSDLSGSSLEHDLSPLQSEINLFSQFSAQAGVELAMADLKKKSDPSWHTLLTNPEGPAPSAPTLTRQEILERDAAMKEARAASTAAAAAANAGSVGGCCDSDGCGGKKRS
jgi:hypothetical protein